jgi:hypothetical protein
VADEAAPIEQERDDLDALRVEVEMLKAAGRTTEAAEVDIAATAAEPPGAASDDGQSNAPDSEAALVAQIRDMFGYDEPETRDAVSEEPVASVVTMPALDDEDEEASDDQDAADPSIEQYMADLLKRVGGEPASWRPAERQPPRKVENTAAPRRSEPEPAEKSEPKPQPLRPKPANRNAPEGAADMRAFRELANLSARTAITKHSKRHSKSTAAGSVVFAAAMAAVAGVLLLWWPNDNPLAYYGGILAVVAALLWTAKAYRTTFDAKQLPTIDDERPTREVPGGPPQ